MRISIVTPSYNHAPFIERTIESILQQKGDFELEYRVVDGGSDDGPLDILERYGDKAFYLRRRQARRLRLNFHQRRRELRKDIERRIAHNAETTDQEEHRKRYYDYPKPQ